MLASKEHHVENGTVIEVRTLPGYRAEAYLNIGEDGEGFRPPRTFTSASEGLQPRKR